MTNFSHIPLVFWNISRPPTSFKSAITTNNHHDNCFCLFRDCVVADVQMFSYGKFMPIAYLIWVYWRVASTEWEKITVTRKIWTKVEQNDNEIRRWRPKMKYECILLNKSGNTTIQNFGLNVMLFLYSAKNSVLTVSKFWDIPESIPKMHRIMKIFEMCLRTGNGFS